MIDMIAANVAGSGDSGGELIEAPHLSSCERSLVTVAKKVRIGVIGTGGIANGAHLPGYSQIPDECEIYALCDIDPKALEKTAAKYPQVEHLFDDHKKLLKMPEIDAVSVCTPNFAHYECTLNALKAGKHVLCEKP